MKKAKILSLVLFVSIAGMVMSCSTFHQTPEGTVVTDEAYQNMTPEQQAQYSDEFKAISTPVAEGVSDTLKSGQEIAGALGPTGEVVSGLIGVLGLIWIGITKVKLRKGKEELDSIKAGAAITAENIEAVIGSLTDVWAAFKNKQATAKTKVAAETGVVPIMPDKVTL